eukprot:1874969-Rhodomonas_salina.2
MELMSAGSSCNVSARFTHSVPKIVGCVEPPEGKAGIGRASWLRGLGSRELLIRKVSDASI